MVHFQKPKRGGDEYIVIKMDKKSKPRNALYAFTKKYLDENQSLWIFVPNTPGWDFYQNLIIPQYKITLLNITGLRRNTKKIIYISIWVGISLYPYFFSLPSASLEFKPFPKSVESESMTESALSSINIIDVFRII